MKRSVLKVFPSATVHVTLAEAAKKLRELCSSGVFKFVGDLLRKQIESVNQWVEILVSVRAPTLPDTTAHIFLGQVINRFSCFLRVDVASMLTDQVKESFTGRKGWTKLYSTVPLQDMKKIDAASP